MLTGCPTLSNARRTSSAVNRNGAKAGSRGDREPSPKKLRGKEIADAIIGALEMDDRGFIPEFAVWATNPF